MADARDKQLQNERNKSKYDHIKQIAVTKWLVSGKRKRRICTTSSTSEVDIKRQKTMPELPTVTMDSDSGSDFEGFVEDEF